MSLRRVRIVLLCEDDQHETFTRRFLKRMGWETREIRVVISPSAGGSAEQWVRLNFPEELKAYRTQSNKRATALITVIDADNKDIHERLRDFEKECTAQQISFRASDEAVAIVVPKRNIETWIRYLSGQPVNETDDYKLSGKKQNCKTAINNLVQLCKSTGLSLDAPKSLQAACDEYRKRIRPISSE